MNIQLTIVVIVLCCCVVGVQISGIATAQEPTASNMPTLEQVKATGRLRSSYRKPMTQAKNNEEPLANLKTFRAEIEPILKKACYECHGSETAEGEIRIDALDPDLLHGEDVDWWLEVSAAVTNDEMPPEEGLKLTDDNRCKIIAWLSSEIQIASQVRRAEQGHSSFRRMTRYEYNYALQDLLGLELEFANDLPPDPVSEDGFKNSSQNLQMSAKQYAEYLQINRDALNRATVRGERPEVLYRGVSAERAATRRTKTRQELDAEIEQNAKKTEGETDKDAKVEVQATETPAGQRGNRGRRRGRGGRGAHYLNTKTGKTFPVNWSFRRAVHAWTPTLTLPEVPKQSDYVDVLPAGQDFIVELGNRLPDEGTLRVRIRAWRESTEPNLVPSLALDFGWQGNNNSKGSVRISERDLEIDAPPQEPQFYQWNIPLSEIYPRNPARKMVELGAPKRTNPSEFLQLQNTSSSQSSEIQFDYVEVSAPVYERWPPASHANIFIVSENSDDENAYAREIVSRFMRRAWRRSVTDAEVDLKMKFFESIRPVCDDFQHAVIEVLATVLSSPRFLYLVRSEQSPTEADRMLDEFELATRIAMFLWCSIPDDELIDLATKGRLSDTDELVRQTKRMLSDPRHKRFTKHFVKQWLNMSLLEFLSIDRSTYPQFDNTLKEAWHKSRSRCSSKCCRMIAA